MERARQGWHDVSRLHWPGTGTESSISFPHVLTGKEQQAQISKVFQAPEIATGVADYFKTTTRHLLDLHGCPLPGTRHYVIDVVRDVLKPLPALWAANELVRAFTFWD